MMELVNAHPVVSHPFLKRFREGTLTREQVQRWAQEQFYFSLSFPDTLAILFARIPITNIREKRKLLDMLNQEARGGKDPDSHEAYLEQFITFLGLDGGVLLQQQPKWYTQQFIRKRQEICLQRPIEESLAALAIGNEILNLTIFNAYAHGINKVQELNNCPKDYFEAHLHDEQEDFDRLADAFESITRKNKIEEDRIRSAIIEMLDARKQYFDELLMDLESDSISA